MLIHTFEVSSLLNNGDFYKIQEVLKSKDKDKWEGKKNSMSYWGLSDKGIIINMYRIKKKGFYSYSITYRISARRVLDNNNYVGLFNTMKYYKLEKTVNELLKSKSDLLPKLDKCNMRRIDFCVNAEMENQEQVKAYIDTARRCNIPSRMSRYTINGKPSKNDMTVYTDAYVAVSIYNKYRQMKNEQKKKKLYSDDDFKKAENIVRIEVRCMEGKVKSLKKKYNISSVSSFMDLSDTIGNDVFNYYLTKMFNNGTIYTLSETRKIIELSGYKQQNKELLNNFFSEMSELRSSAKAMDIYKDAYGKSEVKRIIYMLDNIDLSYVTATAKSAAQFNKEYIPKPIELVNEFLK